MGASGSQAAARCVSVALAYSPSIEVARSALGELGQSDVRQAAHAARGHGGPRDDDYVSDAVRPEVVALWLGSDPAASAEAGHLVHCDGRPFSSAELDLAWSLSRDERAAVLEALELRVTEAVALLAHEQADGAARIAAADARVAASEKRVADITAELAMLHRADYRNHCRRRAWRRGWDRTRPWAPSGSSGP